MGTEESQVLFRLETVQLSEGDFSFFGTELQMWATCCLFAKGFLDLMHEAVSGKVKAIIHR